VVDVRVLDRRVDLSRRECWLLYVWLGQDAPFVRNQLSVVRNGGSGAVSISSSKEASEVLAALSSSSVDPDELTGGLRSLRVALGVRTGDGLA
jgi:hypothetical protein